MSVYVSKCPECQKPAPLIVINNPDFEDLLCLPCLVKATQEAQKDYADDNS